jgi:hypothetical protein
MMGNRDGMRFACTENRTLISLARELAAAA